MPIDFKHTRQQKLRETARLRRPGKISTWSEIHISKLMQREPNRLTNQTDINTEQIGTEPDMPIDFMHTRQRKLRETARLRHPGKISTWSEKRISKLMQREPNRLTNQTYINREQIGTEPDRPIDFSHTRQQKLRENARLRRPGKIST